MLVLKGAELLLLPYNCEGDPFNFAVFPHLPATNVVPVVAADTTGTVYQGGGYGTNMGSAFAIDEVGNVLGHTTPGVGEILIVDLDMAKAKAARQKAFTARFYRNRRPDLYLVLTETTRLPV